MFEIEYEITFVFVVGLLWALLSNGVRTLKRCLFAYHISHFVV